MSAGRGSVKTWVLSGLALLIIAVAAVLIYFFALKENPAEEATDDFLAAVVEGDGETAYEWLYGKGKTAVVDYSTVEDRPTGYELIDSYDVFDGTVVIATLQFDDGRTEEYKFLVADTETGPQIEQDSLPAIHIRSDQGYTLEINGVPLEVNDTQRFRVLPGTYDISAVSDSSYTQANATAHAFTGSTIVELTSELTEEGQAHVVEAGYDYLRSCTEITVRSDFCDVFAIQTNATMGADTISFTWVDEPTVSVRSADLSGKDDGVVILDVHGGTAEITTTFGDDEHSHTIENYFGTDGFAAGALRATLSGHGVHVRSR